MKKISFLSHTTSYLVCFLMMMMAITVTSCDNDDDAIEVKDYGAKTFSADLNYDSEAAHGEVSYKDQVYFSFSDSLVETDTYGTTGWTDFNLVTDSSAYKINSDVEGWDLAFTSYTANLGTESEPMPYTVTGALLNVDTSIKVALIDYADSEITASISTAFADLVLSDISELDFSSDVDAIGYSWKSFSMATYQYSVKANYFYIVKLNSDTYYKMRFVSFYGASSSERIATIEYQLMQ